MDEWDRLLELTNLEADMAFGHAADMAFGHAAGMAFGPAAGMAFGPAAGPATERTQWVTLAEAEAEAGVSRSALRTWFRAGELPSQVIDGPHGPQRLVPLEAVVQRAQQSPRIRQKVARATSLEAEVAALRDRVAALEARLAAWEDESPR